MLNSELIAEKLIYCSDLLLLKTRAKRYSLIENNPKMAKDVKEDLILSNLYSLRMNVDVAFKREMFRRLNSELKKGFSINKCKNLIIGLIDELERSPDTLLNVFSSESLKKPLISLEPINDYINKILTGEYLINLNENSQMANGSLNFFRKIKPTINNGTVLSRALDDLILEYETGIFFPRHFKPGKIKAYMGINFNPYFISQLEYRLEHLTNVEILLVNLLQLTPEYYFLENKLTDLIHRSLIELFEFEGKLLPAKVSVLTIHFMTVLSAILFNNMKSDEKLELLKTKYDFTLTIEDLKNIFENLEEFINMTPTYQSSSEISSDSSLSKLKLSSPLLYLWKKAKVLSIFNIHSLLIPIYKFINIEAEEKFAKIIAQDNVATALRDLGKYKEAVDAYKQTEDFYQEAKEYYHLFLVRKNIAFCYFRLGNIQRSEQIFSKLEEDISVYSKEELVSVYINFAARYRLLNQFDKEELFLNKTFKIIKQNHTHYFDIQERSNELAKHIDFKTGKLDLVALRKLEMDRDKINYLRIAYTFLNSNLLNLCEIYLERAFESVQKDEDYWKVKCNINILTERWDDLQQTSEAALKINPDDPLANFYLCVHFIYKKDIDNTVKQLLKLSKETQLINAPDLLAGASILRAFHFIIRAFSNKEFKFFIDTLLTKTGDLNSEVKKIVLLYGDLLNNVSDKELSGYIFKKLMIILPQKDGSLLYGSWCIRFNDYENAEHFYLKALKISPNDPLTLELNARIKFILNEFGKGSYYLDRALKVVEKSEKKRLKELKEYFTLIRDSKLRYENIPFKDSRTIFKTVEFQLKTLEPAEDLDFGNILTELSKGLETILANTIGRDIYKYVEAEYLPISMELRHGNGKDIRGLHILMQNFFDAPQNHHPTMGNWSYIIKGILNGSDPKNPIMKAIYEYMKNSNNFDQSKFKLIVKIEGLFKKDRNLGTHKRLYNKKEVENIIKTLIPLINELIEYLSNDWKEG